LEVICIIPTDSGICLTTDKERRERGRRNPHPKTGLQFIMIENEAASNTWPIPSAFEDELLTWLRQKGKDSQEASLDTFQIRAPDKSTRCNGYKQTKNTTYLYPDGSFKDGLASWAVWHSDDPGDTLNNSGRTVGGQSSNRGEITALTNAIKTRTVGKKNIATDSETTQKTSENGLSPTQLACCGKKRTQTS
jgi:hypothetical protein